MARRKDIGNGIKIEWHRGAFYRLRSEPGVVSALEGWAERVADEANGLAGTGTGGYRTSSRQGARRPQGRWRTTVITATADVMEDNAANNTLIRALRSVSPIA